MALQPADKNSSEQDANIASNNALQPRQEKDDNKYGLLPSRASTAQTEVILEDYTIWTFYVNWNNYIIYEHSSRDAIITDYLRVDGKQIQATPNALASVQFHGHPRLYYYDRYGILSEVYQKSGSTYIWEEGDLGGFEWKGNPEFGLTALSQNLTQGVDVRVRYHDQNQYDGWSFAEWVRQGSWIKSHT